MSGECPVDCPTAVRWWCPILSDNCPVSVRWCPVMSGPDWTVQCFRLSEVSDLVSGHVRCCPILLSHLLSVMLSIWSIGLQVLPKHLVCKGQGVCGRTWLQVHNKVQMTTKHISARNLQYINPRGPNQSRRGPARGRGGRFVIFFSRFNGTAR